MFELIPSVKVSNWRSQDEDPEAINTAYQQIRHSILVRDNFTCKACGFESKPERDPRKASDDTYKASGFLEVHHINDDHTNNKDKDNMITLCPFCHQVFTVGLTGHTKAAKVIWFPHLSQAQINLMANLALVQTVNSAKAEMADYSIQFLMWLQATSTKAAERFGEDIIESKNLGAALFQLFKKRPDLYKMRGDILNGLKLLPTGIPHQRQLDWWEKSGSWTPTSQWEQILDTWNSQRG